VKDKILAFFLTHGFKIMLSGFSLSVIGIIIYIKMQHTPGPLRQLGGTFVLIGIGVYILGRILVISQNRKLRKERMQEADGTMHKDISK